jgi:hypothetical protein
MWRRLERIIGYSLLLLLLIGSVWLYLLDVRSTRDAARPSICRNNLKMIALALHNYRDRYGSFPPAFFPDAQGRPIHSWRTLLLPFLDQSALYEQYRFDEPWDGPHNSQLHATPMPVLACPSDRSSKARNTSYLAVVGSKAAWLGEQPAGAADFPDGMESTILVVEVADSGIHWMEPRDLNYDDMSFKLNDRASRSISSHHTKPGEGDLGVWPWTKTVPYAHVAFADGWAKRIRGDTPPETIRALLTTNGGEPVSREGLEP